MSEQGAPEVIIKDVGPWGLREKVLVGLDGTTRRKRNTFVNCDVIFIVFPSNSSQTYILMALKGKQSSVKDKVFVVVVHRVVMSGFTGIYGCCGFP